MVNNKGVLLAFGARDAAEQSAVHRTAPHNVSSAEGEKLYITAFSGEHTDF